MIGFQRGTNLIFSKNRRGIILCFLPLRYRKRNIYKFLNFKYNYGEKYENNIN